MNIFITTKRDTIGQNNVLKPWTTPTGENNKYRKTIAENSVTERGITYFQGVRSTTSLLL